jgi:glycine hydroxymethyltransferase
MLVDLQPKGLTGSRAVDSLEAAGLTCNKNMIPFDPQPAEIASGLRLSSNAGSARGFGTQEFIRIGQWIGRVLDALAPNPDDNSVCEQTVRAEVGAVCADFPIYR